MATSTPWGKSQTSRRFARGITQYITAGHGGFKLSQARFDALPAELKAHKPFARHLWYEEDCDWSVVALGYPDEYCAGMGFDSAQRARVLAGARQTFEQATGRTLSSAS